MRWDGRGQTRRIDNPRLFALVPGAVLRPDRCGLLHIHEIPLQLLEIHEQPVGVKVFRVESYKDNQERLRDPASWLPLAMRAISCNHEPTFVAIHSTFSSRNLFFLAK